MYNIYIATIIEEYSTFIEVFHSAFGKKSVSKCCPIDNARIIAVKQTKPK